MHWVLYIGLIWAAIYLTSILLALLVNVLLPIPPFMAALSGLVGALIGVLYYLAVHAESPIKRAIAEIGPEGPSASLRDVDVSENLGGIVAELRNQESTADDAEEPQSAVTNDE